MPPLTQDLANKIAQIRQVPEPPDVAVDGYFLALAREAEEGVAWRQGPDREIITFHGDPNLIVHGAQGQLGVDVDVPELWINTDNVTAWELVAGSGGSGSSTPTDWVEYQLDSPPQGAYAYTVSARTVEWVDGSFSHGGAIVLNAGQPEVTEDGWYAIDTYVLAEATTVGSTWTRGLGILEVNRSFSAGGDTYDNVFLSQVFGPYVDNAGRWGGNASFSWMGYLKAGDSVAVSALLSADSAPGDTWRIAEAQFRMEKLPM